VPVLVCSCLAFGSNESHAALGSHLSARVARTCPSYLPFGQRCCKVCADSAKFLLFRRIARSWTLSWFCRAYLPEIDSLQVLCMWVSRAAARLRAVTVACCCDDTQCAVAPCVRACVCVRAHACVGVCFARYVTCITLSMCVRAPLVVVIAAATRRATSCCRGRARAPSSVWRSCRPSRRQRRRCHSPACTSPS
jgi:hypothetical protein